MGDAVFVEFDDGKYALYSAPLLYTALPLAIAPNVPDPNAEVENGDE